MHAGSRRRVGRASARWAAAAAVLLSVSGAAQGLAAEAGVNSMKIRMMVNGREVTATLDDTPVARDFAALLPLKLTLTDYASTEKVSDLPRRLNPAGAPPGYDPSVGDITYYAPWGNLAIFYRDFGYASGLIKLGTIDAGLEALQQSGALSTTMETVAP